MGTPREAMRLVGGGRVPRLVTVTTARDFTEAMRRYARERVDALAGDDLCGYVLKSRSPSCGVDGVPVHDSRGRVAGAGRGLFAARLVERFPLLPVEDEGRLGEPDLRDHFIERVFAYRRLRDLFDSRWTPGDLVEFHARNELALMAHSPRACRRLGRLVARGRTMARVDLERRYAEGFMKALATIATPGGHAVALLHASRSFRKRLAADSKRKLLRAIADYRRGRVPLSVPIGLLRRHARRLEIAGLAGQAYLAPHPVEPRLRSRARSSLDRPPVTGDPGIPAACRSGRSTPSRPSG